MGHERHARYWRRFLMGDERVVHTFGVSGWYISIFWLLPAVLMFLVVAYLATLSGILAGLIAIVALSMVMPALYLSFFVHYAITNRRVMTREGIFHKKFVTADLPSVTDISIHESFLERLLSRTGEIGINTAGSHNIEVHFRHVSRPFARREDIYEHQERMKNGAS